MIKFKPKSGNRKRGRPEKITSEIVGKLEEAFAIDATVEEACFYSDISRDCFYEYLKRHSEFADRIDNLRQRPVFIARKTVIENLEINPKIALKYLERKRKDEFSTKQEIEQRGNSTLFLPIEITIKKDCTGEASGDKIEE
jgi:hypothetical protein